MKIKIPAICIALAISVLAAGLVLADYAPKGMVKGVVHQEHHLV